MLSIFLFTIGCYKYIVLWFDCLLYGDEINRIEPINIIPPSESDQQIEVQAYKFKTPGIIK